MRKLQSPWLAAVSLGVLALSAMLPASRAFAADSDAALYQSTVEKGINYLLTKGQQEDGTYGKDAGCGIAALCTTALLKHGRSPDDPAIAKSLRYIESCIHEDGGIYSPQSPVQNYETSIGIQCLAAANADGRYTKQIKKAEKFVKDIQFAGESSDFNYGGAGYDPRREKNKQRPDLSNTGFLLDALKAAGAGADDEAVKRALVFVSRCQNLESEHNTTPYAAKNPDGGFYYTPAAGGVSEAGKTDLGGLRSYGSMTYTGLKSMIFAGLKSDDPRVKAAVSWIKKHYTLQANPGMPTPDDGLYYFYQTFARALNALGQNEIEDEKGVKHNWRHDLITELAKRQREDGSWVNSDKRFYEQNTNLVTAYALMALAYAKPEK